MHSTASKARSWLHDISVFTLIALNEASVMPSSKMPRCRLLKTPCNPCIAQVHGRFGDGFNSKSVRKGQCSWAKVCLILLFFILRNDFIQYRTGAHSQVKGVCRRCENEPLTVRAIRVVGVPGVALFGQIAFLSEAFHWVNNAEH